MVYPDAARQQELAAIAAGDYASSGGPPPPVLMKIDPSTIKTNPAAYQFRSGGDGRGVTGRGRIRATRWDPILHGDPLLVHERMNGDFYVADGHHRLELAQRTNAMGTGPGKVAALVLREADGYTVQDAKLIAAYKNLDHDLTHGRHNATELTDGARVFKEVRSGGMRHPEWLPSLQMDKGDLHLSYRLSNLSDASLAAVADGTVPAGTAAIVADHVPGQPDQDVAIAKLGNALARNYNISVLSDGLPVAQGGAFAAYHSASADSLPVDPGHVARLMEQRGQRQYAMGR